MNKTPWAVFCPHHGQVFLSLEMYIAQLDRPDSVWCCPKCGESAEWDDTNYEASLEDDSREDRAGPRRAHLRRHCTRDDHSRRGEAVSYPRDLDEIPETTLRAELERRRLCRESGICDYCNRRPELVACKFPERHQRFAIRHAATPPETTTAEEEGK
jgi:hypothetical protein